MQFFKLSRFTSFGTSAFTKPVFFFSLVILTVSVILSSLILAGGSNDSPTVRNFYLVSLRYNHDSDFYKSVDNFNNGEKKGNDTKSNDKPSFNEIRVSYQGICVDTTEGWDCAKDSAKLPQQDLANDPLKLVSIADLYKDKIVWSLPFWISCISAGIAYLMVLANCIPIPNGFLTIPFWTKQLAAAMLGIASISTLGGMILGSVTSGSVATLVHTITLEAIEVDNGSMVFATGWASFVLITLAFLGISAVVAVEWSMSKVEHSVESKIEEAIHHTTGGSSFAPSSGVGLGLNRGPSIAGTRIEVLRQGGEKLGTYLNSGSLRK